MLTFLAAIHVFVAILLIFFVLLQDSKGGAMGMLGGGGSNAVLGASGTVNILVKITRWTAILFTLTCIGLTVIIAGQENNSVMNAGSPVATPVESTETIKGLPKDEAKEEKGAEETTTKE